jgi:hypothetical protein
MATDSIRVRIDGDLLFSLDGDIVSLATPRFDPGIFFWHVELLEAEVKPAKNGDWKVSFTATGVSIPFQRTNFTVSVAEIPAFTAFIERAKAARERSRADPGI